MKLSAPVPGAQCPEYFEAEVDRGDLGIQPYGLGTGHRALGHRCGAPGHRALGTRLMSYPPARIPDSSIQVPRPGLFDLTLSLERGAAPWRCWDPVAAARPQHSGFWAASNALITARSS